MVHHIGENRTRVFVVGAKLGAPVIVGERDNCVDAALASGYFGAEAPDQFLADAVDASYRGDDPYLVAYAGLAVGPGKTEKAVLPFCRRDFHERGGVLIVQEPFQVGLYARVVHHRAGLLVAGDVAYGEAVLYDIFALGKVAEDHLMAAGHVRKERHALHDIPCLQVLQGHGYIVVGIDFDVFH